MVLGYMTVNKLAFYIKTRYFVASFFIYMQTNLSSHIAKGILKAIAVLFCNRIANIAVIEEICVFFIEKPV